jgi:hypothetical protein
MSSVAMGVRRAGQPTRPGGGVRSEAAGVRLTRRGRLVVVFACLLLAVGGTFLLRQAPSLAGDEAPARSGFDYVVVQPGQTLWEIAETAAPGVDPRVTIMRIQDLNGLADAAVFAGQRIALPRR